MVYLFSVHRNFDPAQHPFEAAREYTRALNAVKLEKVFAKPFLGSLDGHSDGISYLEKHPSRLSILGSCSYDGEVRIWNLATRKCVVNYEGHKSFARGLTFSGDGNHLISIADDKQIHTWKVPIDNESDMISHEDKFATCGDSTCLWQAGRNVPLREFHWGVDSIHHVRFNMVQENILAACASDRFFLELKSNSLAWNPMEAMIFTVANEDYNCYAFDLRKLERPINVHMDHVSAVIDIDYAPTGRELVTGSYDKTIRIFNVREGHSREIYHTKRMQRLTSVRWSLDNKYIISGSDEMNIRLWKAKASEKLGVLKDRQRSALQYNEKLKENICTHIPKSLIDELPFVLKRNEEDGSLIRSSSAGGLVTAVAPVVIACKGIWVGWTGLYDFKEGIDVIPDQAFPVTVEPKLFDDYYNGCCNGIFWPLFHSMPDRAVFEIAFWKAYTKVNKAFAMTTMNAIRKVNQERMKVPENKRCPSPIVWLHDYHLMKAANIIRDTCKDEGIEIRMAFFLHIPFPTFDILRICPWVDEILMGVLGCDLMPWTSNDLYLLASRIQNFENLSKIAPPIYQPGETKIILGVDRLDYTKGLVARLKALVRLFEKYPKWITKVILVQIAVPSRTEVLEYQELKKQIDILVGQINGDYSTASWAPIRYIYSSMPQHELVGFYPSQKDADPGVLILSPFAGAGNIMHEALMANPYESDNVADTINRALEMPLDERQLRMNQLKKREKKMDVDAWVKMFLLEMDNVENKVLTYPKTMDDLMEDMFEFEDRLGPYVEMSTKLGIILDFDGTLSCLARTPGLAMMAPETKKESRGSSP
ncbi:DCAF13 [Lepeophtheirus salmonis]|uniref:DDB1- and CUL4-associated factor 13 n=1 Tax=Lepeophtheirus salmonis TaxID=72036 RepID=A0A7R8CT40_LEPSM|nr:DCAF13 [Lepeophtheirus salmonis]CAF2886929.1 DCAF13 [Lepeophtheirus salmonis]